MKSYIKLITLIALPIALLFGCTDLMEDMSVSEKALQEEYLKADAAGVKAFIPSMAANINNLTTSWQYQVEQNLNADHFAGYMMSANTFDRPSINAQYNMVDGWNGFIYSVPSNNLSQMVAFKREALPLYPDYYAYGLIMKVLSALPMVDAFGTFPYTKFGTGTDVEWDNLDVIYSTMISELDFAVDTLSNFVDTEKANRISNDISSYQGDYVKFIKLANTLKLRLAMRMSDVEPAKAKAIAEEAVNDKHGVLQAGDGAYSIISEYNHPLWQLGAWGDIQMAADMESIMGGYADPRLPKYFTPATAPETVKGEIKGIREGALIPKGSYVGFSKPNFQKNSPMVLVTAAEAYFLRAEGALKGWNMGGSAQSLYEDGVRASFEQHGLSGADEYLASSATPMAYVDPISPEFSFAPTTEVTPNWADAATDEEKLEKIITQKWIAIFPDGAEAWAEFRRTGYPKLKPIPSSQNPVIPTGEFIKRVPVPSNVTSVSPSRYQEAISKFFGGADNAARRVWWDVE